MVVFFVPPVRCLLDTVWSLFFVTISPLYVCFILNSYFFQTKENHYSNFELIKHSICNEFVFTVKFLSYCNFDNLKGNAQLIFLCNSQKLGASQVFVTFLQVTQKVLTKDIFHWLEMINEILSFLQIFSVRKKHSLF